MSFGASFRIVTLILTLFPLAAGGAGPAHLAPGLQAAWTVELVDWSGNVGPYNSLALDALDQPHIGYYDETHGDLRYAFHDGTLWITATVHGADEIVGTYASLALDGGGVPHLSYYDEQARDLRYATLSGTTWISETVDPGAPGASYVGTWSALALDDAGRPYISYFDQSHEALKVATLSGTTWISETVDAGLGYWGGQTAIAVDSAGRPHVSYFDWTHEALRYATLSGTTWLTTTVHSSGNVGRGSSVAVDPAGRPQISYYGDGDLLYARYDGAAWQTQVVDGEIGYWGGYTSLAVDAAGRAHVSYYDHAASEIRYAYRDGGLWWTEGVHAVGSTSGYTSLALDGAGRPHISFYDADGQDLYYARRGSIPARYHVFLPLANKH